LYSIEVSGAVGDLVFDRRGFIRHKGRSTNPKTAKQGNAGRQPHKRHPQLTLGDVVDDGVEGDGLRGAGQPSPSG